MSKFTEQILSQIKTDIQHQEAKRLAAIKAPLTPSERLTIYLMVGAMLPEGFLRKHKSLMNINFDEYKANSNELFSLEQLSIKIAHDLLFQQYTATHKSRVDGGIKSHAKYEPLKAWALNEAQRIRQANKTLKDYSIAKKITNIYQNTDKIDKTILTDGEEFNRIYSWIRKANKA